MKFHVAPMSLQMFINHKNKNQHASHAHKFWVNAHYTHPKRVDESPFLQSKSSDFSKKKHLNDVEIHIFFPFPSSYHHNYYFLKPLKI
jgi:hypothetical protein